MERLKELRTARGLLQKDVAAVLGIDRTTYVKYEKGQSEPSFDILTKLADYFGVSVDYLLGKTDIKKTPPGSPLTQLYHKTTAVSIASIRKIQKKMQTSTVFPWAAWRRTAKATR